MLEAEGNQILLRPFSQGRMTGGLLVAACQLLLPWWPFLHRSSPQGRTTGGLLVADCHLVPWQMLEAEHPEVLPGSQILLRPFSQGRTTGGLLVAACQLLLPWWPFLHRSCLQGTSTGGLLVAACQLLLHRPSQCKDETHRFRERAGESVLRNRKHQRDWIAISSQWNTRGS